MDRYCPICGGKGSTLYTNSMAALASFNMSYAVHSCGDCESVFAQDIPSEDIYREYYSSFSKYDLVPTNPHSESATVHWGLAELIKEHVGQNLTILDIGCGNGHFLHCLENIGFTSLLGIDPSPNASSVAKKYYNLTNISVGFIDKSSDAIAAKHIDVLSFCAVLEHLCDPFSTLQHVLGKMPQGSWVALEVPDLDAFDGNAEPYGELSLEHINYFSERSLRLLFQRLGYAVVKCEHVRHSGGGSLLAVLQKKSSPSVKKQVTNDFTVMQQYLATSESKLRPLIDILLTKINKPFVIYGAGSHTARLMPRLQQHDKLKYCIAVVDNNENIHGATLDNVPVFPVRWLDENKDCHVIISSFKAQNEIVKSLQSKPCTYDIIY